MIRIRGGSDNDGGVVVIEIRLVGGGHGGELLRLPHIDWGDGFVWRLGAGLIAFQDGASEVRGELAGRCRERQRVVLAYSQERVVI
jgi:hypothetical protein